MAKAYFSESSRFFTISCSFTIAITILMMSCGPDKKQNATDSLNLHLKVDSVLKIDSAIPQSDSVLPFEQDTQKIMETLDLLDSIRHAKYN